MDFSKVPSIDSIKTALRVYDSPIASITLLTGENAFSLEREVHRWIDEYDKRHGAENIITVNAQECSLKALLDHLQSPSLFAAKRLVILQGIPRIDAEEVDRVVRALHDDVVLLVVAPAVDRRLGGVKRFLECATVVTFDLLTPAALRLWVREVVSQRGTIDDEAITALLDACGNDQHALFGELHRLLIQSPHITRLHIQESTLPIAEGVVWELLDALAQSGGSGAIASIEHLAVRGVSVDQQWAIFCNFLGSIPYALPSGRSSSPSVKSGVHPRTLQSLKSLLQRAGVERVCSAVRQACQYEQDLKSGLLKGGEAHSEEVAAALTCVLATLST